MADSFFGFDSDLPGHMAGGDQLNNQLMEAAEDDAIDQMNDETFGDINDGVGWEEQHEKLAEEIKMGQRSAPGDVPYDPEDMQLQEKKKKAKEFMKQSISQLVVEDEEEEETPSLSNGSKHGPVSMAKPIPTRNNLDELFGPSSPPGILSAEQLVSPGKQNIWGSPAKDAFLNSQEDSLKALLRQLQSPLPPVGVVQQQRSGNLPNAKTVEELEQELLTSGKNGNGGAKVMTVEELERGMCPPGGAGKPPTSLPPGFPFPIGTPPGGSPFSVPPPGHHHMHQIPHGHQGHHPLLTNGSHHHQKGGMHQQRTSPSPDQALPQGSVPVMLKRTPGSHHASLGHTVAPPSAMTKRTSPPVGYNSAVGSPPVNVHMNKRTSPPVGYRGSPNIHTVAPPSVAARMPPMGPQSGSPYSHAVAAGVLSPAVLKPEGGGSPVNGIKTTSPPPYMASTPVRQRPPMPAPLSDPGHLHGHQRLPQQHHSTPPGKQPFFQNQGRPPFHSHNQGQRGGYRQGQHRHLHGNYPPPDMGGHGDDGDDMDPYSGLMTQREKDWIIKIQLMQLHTENPYVDDYYYTTWMLKKVEAERERKKREEGGGGDEKDGKAPKLIIPALAKGEARIYKPVQFEGSLGRLTASSVHNPRQIIDVKTNDIKPTDENQKVRRFKQLLLRIEKAYDSLLEIDEMAKQALAIAEESRPALYQHRQDRISELVDILSINPHQDAEFLHLMSVRKGKKLLARILPLCTKDEAVMIVMAVLRSMSSWTRKEQMEEMCSTCLRAVCDWVEGTDVPTLLLITQVLQTAGLTEMITSKFSLSVTWALLHQAERITQSMPTPAFTGNQETQWLHFVTDVAECLAENKMNIHENIQGRFPLAVRHLDRHLTSSSVMEKLMLKLQLNPGSV